MKTIMITPNIGPVAVLVSVLVTFTAFSQEAPKLSDPEVASVAVVANRIDIGYAEIAKKKSKDAAVLKFAETTINDHTAVIEKAAALVKIVLIASCLVDCEKKSS